jgi:membrane-associated HD superfamily phosphohydrolase
LGAAVNWLAVIAAAVSMFVIGGLWYSPMVFGKQWQVAAGLSDEQRKGGNVPLIFGLAFVFSFLMAANLGFFLAALEITLATAVGYAVAAGLGWAALGLGVIALFERRPLSYFLINGGYLTVAFAVMGLILGLWR